jgi:hypothetical protein
VVVTTHLIDVTRWKRNWKAIVVTEESVVSKVKKLMEALDSIKRYSALARALKKVKGI